MMLPALATYIFSPADPGVLSRRGTVAGYVDRAENARLYPKSLPVRAVRRVPASSRRRR